MLLKLAWRNLWRTKRRTVITLISIAFGLLLSITFTSLSHGSYRGYIDSAARMGAGHVTVEPEDFRDNPSADKSLTDAKELAEKIRNTEGIRSATVRIVGQAMAATASDSAGVAFFAIDPGSEKGILFMLDHIKKGSLFEANDKRGALIGKNLAEQLEVKIGSKMVVTTTDKQGEIVSNLAKVRGIFETGIDQVDRFTMVLPIESVRKLLGYDKGEATQIAVFLDNRREAGDQAEGLRPLAAGHGGVVLPWFEQMPEVSGMISMDKNSNYIFQIFVFLLIGAGILNTILMGVLERMREMGIMLATGISPGRLFALVMLESFWLGLVGLVAGLIVSAPVYWYLHTVGLDFTAYIAENTSFSGAVFDPIVKCMLYWDHLAVIVSGVFVLVLLSGVYPAFVATRISPIKALKTM